MSDITHSVPGRLSSKTSLRNARPGKPNRFSRSRVKGLKSALFHTNKWFRSIFFTHHPPSAYSQPWGGVRQRGGPFSFSVTKIPKIVCFSAYPLQAFAGLRAVRLTRYICQGQGSHSGRPPTFLMCLPPWKRKVWFRASFSRRMQQSNVDMSLLTFPGSFW